MKNTKLVFNCSSFVATPEPDSTRLVDPNRNLGRLILFIYLFIKFSFFKNVATRIPGPTPMADLNRSPVYFDVFIYLSKHLFMSFSFTVFKYAEAFSNGRPNITFIQIVYKMAYHAFTK